MATTWLVPPKLLIFQPSKLPWLPLGSSVLKFTIKPSFYLATNLAMSWLGTTSKEKGALPTKHKA